MPLTTSGLDGKVKLRLKLVFVSARLGNRLGRKRLSYFSFSVNLSLYDSLCYFIPHLACYIYKHIVVSNINVFSKLFFLKYMASRICRRNSQNMRFRAQQDAFLQALGCICFGDSFPTSAMSNCLM